MRWPPRKCSTCRRPRWTARCSSPASRWASGRWRRGTAWARRTWPPFARPPRPARSASRSVSRGSDRTSCTRPRRPASSPRRRPGRASPSAPCARGASTWSPRTGACWRFPSRASNGSTRSTRSSSSRAGITSRWRRATWWRASRPRPTWWTGLPSWRAPGWRRSYTPLLMVRPYAGVTIAAVVAEPLAPEGRDRFEEAARLRAESLDGVFLGVHDLDAGDPTAAARDALEELALRQRAGVLLVGGVSAGDPLAPIFAALEALGGVGVPARRPRASRVHALARPARRHPAPGPPALRRLRHGHGGRPAPAAADDRERPSRRHPSPPSAMADCLAGRCGPGFRRTLANCPIRPPLDLSLVKRVIRA